MASDVGASIATGSIGSGLSNTSVTSGLPVVNVPVLSKTKVVSRSSCSSTSPPRIRSPCSAPRLNPTNSAVGVASPKAQGQAMTRTAIANFRLNSKGDVTKSGLAAAVMPKFMPKSRPVLRSRPMSPIAILPWSMPCNHAPCWVNTSGHRRVPTSPQKPKATAAIVITP